MLISTFCINLSDRYQLSKLLGYLMEIFLYFNLIDDIDIANLWDSFQNPIRNHAILSFLILLTPHQILYNEFTKIVKGYNRQ